MEVKSISLENTTLRHFHYAISIGVIQIVCSSRGGGGGSAENEQSILKLKIFLYKKRTRGEGGLKVDKVERKYYLNGP